MNDMILQSQLPFAAWMDPRLARLPGILPIEGEDWLRVDDAFLGQMALRDHLLATQTEAVVGIKDGAGPAADELYETVLTTLRRNPDYRVGASSVTRPDGVDVALDPARPMETLGRLVQEDLCVMEKQGDAHVLTAAVLCFPASWTLAEKLGRPLLGIHKPVKTYDADLAVRVQRLFDMIRVGQPLWRANALVYRDHRLHQPHRESDPRIDRRGGSFVRSERQCLLRLPKTQAVIFSIHTYVVKIQSLSAEELAGLQAARL